MRSKFPSHLYIRVDRDLKSALRTDAQASGETVSVLARNALAVGLTVIRNQAEPDNDGLPPRTPPAAPMRAAA